MISVKFYQVDLFEFRRLLIGRILEGVYALTPARLAELERLRASQLRTLLYWSGKRPPTVALTVARPALSDAIPLG